MDRSEVTKHKECGARCRKQGNRFAKQMFLQSGHSVSVGDGALPHRRNKTMTPAFTLIEVMVSVMIISVVIASLLQLFSNNTHLLGGMKERVDMAMRSTLLLGIGDRGFERGSVTLDDLVEGFAIDDDLRRRLKTTRLELDYIERMRLGEEMAPQVDVAGENEEGIEVTADTPVLEIGTTSLKIDEQQTSLVRITLQ